MWCVCVCLRRIASGCDEKKMKELKALYKKLWSQQGYGVHFTPDFKLDKATGVSYDFYNKPYGLKHWFDHTLVKSNVVIALIDPDFVFMRPLNLKLKDDASLLFFGRRKPGYFPLFFFHFLP